MNISRWFLLIIFLYSIIFLSHAVFLRKTVYGDGIFYFSWVRSIVVDHDINFANDYAHFGVTAPITHNNLLGNKHPIGAPLFWLPLYAETHAIIGGSGFELPYQLLVGALSVLAAIAGIILLYRLLTQYFPSTVSLLAVISIAGATNLLFYGAIDTVNSHAISFFAATVFLSFLYSKKASPFLTGCTLGFCALVRPQDAILALLVIPSLKRSHLLRLKFIILLFLGAFLVFAPQLLAWYTVYGTAWISPYLSGGESFTWWSPNFFNVLFSPVNGLFLWTPITLIALGGFIFWKDTRRVWFIAVFLLAVIVVGSWSTWWQGASYSGRMFVSILPVLSFGLASFYKKLLIVGLTWQSILLTIIGPLAVINSILIIRFLLQS
ncbi:MAG: glycosyltransferase family 39 protein [Candidatus Gottesmanbacteria bacterium]|nr:glycosyltransferase family 39 protein [Candidatus Gottesmanbacteria bacterium]